MHGIVDTRTGCGRSLDRASGSDQVINTRQAGCLPHIVHRYGLVIRVCGSLAIACVLVVPSAQRTCKLTSGVPGGIVKKSESSCSARGNRHPP